MRQSHELPQDDGSRRFHLCPPSHHKMALSPQYAQASARVPRPSQPSTHSLVSPGNIPYHQHGSTKPWAAPPAPLARVNPPQYGDPSGRSSVGLMAPSPMSFVASMPLYSPLRSVSFGSLGGEYTLTAWPTPCHRPWHICRKLSR